MTEAIMPWYSEDFSISLKRESYSKMLWDYLSFFKVFFFLFIVLMSTAVRAGPVLALWWDKLWFGALRLDVPLNSLKI